MINSKANILLTSAGPTTADIQDHLRSITKEYGNQHTRVVRITDGMAGLEISNRFWSNCYLEYVLGRGRYTLQNVRALSTTPLQLGSLLKETDMLLVPAGNTYKTMLGLLPHIATIRALVNDGVLVYMGESAGSIVAGSSLLPAAIPPVDKRPPAAPESGLSLVDGHVIVHVAGRGDSFEIPGVVSTIASRLMSRTETPSAVVDDYKDTLSPNEVVYTLQNNQALFISKGTATII